MKITFCRICECACGLKVRLTDGKVTDVAPDPDNPLSRGFICIKGANAAGLVHHPSRLLHPLRRRITGWERATWETAFSEIGRRLRAIREENGADAIALYLGSPGSMSAVAYFVASAFLRSLGSSRQFSSMSLDSASKPFVAEEMFGDRSFVLQKDWENAKYMLVFGHNPRASGFGQMSTRPRGLDEVRAARAKGGRLVLVDPKRTETAGLADEYFQIVPATDVFLLLALLNVVIAERRCHDGFIDRYCDRFEVLVRVVAEFTPERVARVTGIPAATVRRIAREFATAGGAFAMGNTGVTQQRHSTVAEWAIQALNAITGNIDRPGGLFYNPGAIDEPRPKRTIEWDRPSRIRGYPRVLGEHPTSTLADEILTPAMGTGGEQIRALLVVAGDPLTNGPDVMRLRKAIGSLEFLVAVDLFMSRTAECADWVLPATTFLERSDLNITITRHMPFPFIQYTERVVEPQGEARDEWAIFQGLHAAVGTPFLNNGALAGRLTTPGADGPTVEAFFDDFLRRRGRASFDQVKANPHGVRLGGTPIGEFRRALERRAQKIDLAPETIIRAMPRLESIATATAPDYPMRLISRRDLRCVGSWLLGDVGGNTLEMNPADAGTLGVSSGGRVRVRSRTGEIAVAVELSDAVPPGVVTMQFGLARGVTMPGGNEDVPWNILVDSEEACDEVTGMPTLNGIPVRVEAIDEL